MKRLTVRPNYCKCHPETCCCNDWAVYQGEEKLTTFFNEKDAVDFVETYNENLDLRQKLKELRESIND